MLLSPGHSPRHLSSPSPSPSHSLSTSDHLSSSNQQPKPPQKSPAVLDEDSYVAAIEKIIERDFFPDIPKLRDRLDWLEAVRTRDPVQIRDAQLKILERRRGSNPDEGKTRTPGSTFFKNSVTPLNLIEPLLEKEENEVKGVEDVKRDRITDGYGTSDQPTSTLEGWKYCAKNLLMYHPADRGEAPLTEEELAQRLKGLTKEVDRYNTRFHGKMSDSGPKDEDEVEVLYSAVAGGTPVMIDRNRDMTKKYDLEDLRKTPNMFYVESEKKADNGYSFVKTPSPAPGSEDTPLDIGGSGDGSHFKIPSVPTRDLKAHSLSREAARKLKERSRMYRKPPMPSPIRSGSASPSVRTLSPAAQKFVRKAMAKSTSTVDESLRASYRGKSPALGTPKAGRSESRLGRDGTIGSKSPSVRDGSNPPW
ncbi:Splicing factor ESS-2-like protein [Bienertia sinuspersici]